MLNAINGKAMSGRYFIKQWIFILVLIAFCNSLFAQNQHSEHLKPTEKAKLKINESPTIKKIRKKPIAVKQGMRGTNRIVDLIVSYKVINVADQKKLAIAVNNQIPAPTLHFKEGEHITINVHNHLDKGTAIHWHGILVPWQMDGVENVNQKAIPPGGIFQYQFTAHQAGTYWYHAHKDVQEQEGLYGAFIIDPPEPPSYQYNKDYVIILSDWSNTPAEQVFANLKRDGEYYSPSLPLQPSLIKFLHDYNQASSQERKLLLKDYKMMQQMRMGIYDLSDIAYDAYLLNGHSNINPWHAAVKVGDIVRLRFIGASGSTIYRVKIPNTTIQMVHVQGNDVKPSTIENFDIAPGETIDVLVKIEKNKPYIIYAESLDTRGVAIGALITHPNQKIDCQYILPFDEPKPVTRNMMANMMMTKMNHSSMNIDNSKHSMKMSKHSNHVMQPENTEKMKSTNEIMKHKPMNHSMNMPIEPTIIGDRLTSMNQSAEIKTYGTKYQNLTADVPTNDPDKPVKGIIKMELFGYMDRFIWFINGLPEYKTKPISLEQGKRYRIIFINNSMMRHPMHIHGHWFILQNGHGAYNPLLHTIEVPPGATAVADIETDASGQWFFHCHHLYHMMAGMARVFQYETIIEVAQGLMKPQIQISIGEFVNRPIVRVDEEIPIDKSLITHPSGHHSGFYFANLLDVGEDPFSNIQRLTFKGLYGPDYDKLELFINDAEINKGTVDYADIDIFYWHLVSQFWTIKGGVNYFYRPARIPYWQPGIGVEGLMPYFIAVNFRGYYYKGSAKLDLELSRDTQITNNFFVRLGIRSILGTKTVESAAIGNGLNQMRYIVRPYYRLMPGVNLIAEFEREEVFGAFKNILLDVGETTNQNTLTFGISLLF